MSSCLKAEYPAVNASLPPVVDPKAGSVYLTDESRFAGEAEKIFIPKTEDEVLALLREAQASKIAVTFSGARTGITGGAVPQGGWLVSLEKLRAFKGLRRDPKSQENFLLRCQPGLTLDDIKAAVAAKCFPGSEAWGGDAQEALREFQKLPDYVFPPDPTESTAGLGGMVACNASGARTLHYGPTRHYVHAVRHALADGSLLVLERGKHFADADHNFQFVDYQDKIHQVKLPSYQMPKVKNAAGYYSRAGMDLLDLFIGAEGTLGVFTEVEIILVPKPEAVLGAVAFFPDETQACRFVEQSRTQVPQSEGIKLLALEYFDERALNLLRDQKERQGSGSIIPALPPEAVTAVYVELTTTDDLMENAAEFLLELLQETGSDPATAWTAMDDDEAARLKNFRHALPETINQRVGERAAKYPGLTKLGSDFAVPDSDLFNILAVYHRELQAGGFEYVIFGHIGDNHLHINVLPRDLEEYERGKEVYARLARAALACGGTISAEHGVGKLKRVFLEMMYGAGVEEMRAVKRVFDPEGRVNGGNVFC